MTGTTVGSTMGDPDSTVMAKLDEALKRIEKLERWMNALEQYARDEIRKP